MRTGGYTFQQSLTQECAAIVRQAMSLARRRGHSHVTPLHVASAMLSSTGGLFRRACLHSHSHPLQCKALELCFNVALNRLPTSSSNPIILGHHHHHHHLPTLSNALVAAFKRAQAHQRRGSIENQQQPILALKVEVEQLVISILDDPSVSRVMREAGFSSTQVKVNVERAVSGSDKEAVVAVVKPPPPPSGAREEDVKAVVEAMAMGRKTRNVVILGECLSTAEGVVRGVIEKINKGEVQEMKHVQFISVPVLPLRNVSRDEFEVKVGELRALVKAHVSRGVVLYLGDLKWVSEFWSNHVDHLYSPVEHMIMELSRLLCGFGDNNNNNGRLWLMGIASFQTYSKCRLGQPSLETLWSLHPLTIPLGSLSLTLKLESDDVSVHQYGSKGGGVLQEGTSWSFGRQHHHSIGGHVEKNNLTCCVDCLANFNKDARNIATNSVVVKSEPTTPTNTNTTTLPSWLQKCKEETTPTHTTTNNDHNQKECDKFSDLCKKWNSKCNTIHKHHHHQQFPLDKTFSSHSPCSSPSISSNDNRQTSKSFIFGPNISPKEHQFFVPETETTNTITKPDLLSNPNSSPNSASSSEASGNHHNHHNLLTELDSENMKILCKALERHVPWHRDTVIPEIASTVLRKRSENLGRTDTWMFFLGSDTEGKERISRELAKAVFGSEDSCICIGTSSFSSSSKMNNVESLEEVMSKKRARDEGERRSHLERLLEAVRENPSRVFVLEDIENIDHRSRKGIERLIERGAFSSDDGDDAVEMKNAIVIFSSESSPPPAKRRRVDDDEYENLPRVTLDLNVASGEDDRERSFLEMVDKQVVFKIQVL